MKLFNETLKKIISSDALVARRTQERLDNLTKPQGSLGRLEEIAKLITSASGKEDVELKNKVIFTIAADHGIAEEGVSAFPREVTAQMVYNFLRGGAGINVLARHVGARVVVADFGVCQDLDPDANLIIKKIGYGTKNMANGPAMSLDQAIKSIEYGVELFNTEFSKGIDIAGIGEMGIGNTTAASAITACLTGKTVEAITGRGTGVSDSALENKIRLIKKAIKINDPDAKKPLEVLSKVGGFEIGGLVGVILACASKKIPVVIDGFISGAAALLAYRLEPKIKEYMIASHCSVEIGHKVILEDIGIAPLLNLNLRLGEGTGAALGINIAEASIKILNQMATFKSAGVSEKN